jgi:hypothetical protein
MVASAWRMALPFSRQQFFDVFAAYNDAVWPAQVALVGVGLFCVAAVRTRSGWQRAVPWALALLWSWMAVAYHFAFFTSINPAAWLFGAVFLAAAVLFVVHANATLRFDGPGGLKQVVGLVFVVYALVGYPLIGLAAGHTYPRMPTFGLPCPTTIFTLGMLLQVRRPIPWTLFIVPMAWSIISTFAAIELGVVQDYFLPIASLITAVVLVRSRAGARLSLR